MINQSKNPNQVIVLLEKKMNQLDNQIEDLKINFNLFFSGEIKVPPEKERETLEKTIKKLLQNQEIKTPKINLLMQNISSKFNLYSNMWGKRLNDIETGVIKMPIKRTKSTSMILTNPEIIKEPLESVEKTISLNLNNENSFNFFIKELKNTVTTKKVDQDKIINNLKLKMISENIINAQAKLTFKNGKVKIKIKRSI